MDERLEMIYLFQIELPCDFDLNITVSLITSLDCKYAIILTYLYFISRFNSDVTSYVLECQINFQRNDDDKQPYKANTSGRWTPGLGPTGAAEHFSKFFFFLGGGGGLTNDLKWGEGAD